MALSRLLSLIVPNRRSNLFGDGSHHRRADSVVRDPVPVAHKDFSGRISLTRPPSPRALLVSELNIPSISALDTLPLEVRQQIWKLLVGGGRKFHFRLVEVQLERRFRAAECLSSNPETCSGSCRRLWGPKAGGVRSSKKLLLPLLLTSRGIYCEAIRCLYSSNVFETDDAESLELLPHLLLPQRINEIRSLVFTWRLQQHSPGMRRADAQVSTKKDQDIREARWKSIWHVIASMQNLQSLHVKLDMKDAWWGPDMLEPIRKVTIPSSFILDIPFPPDARSHAQVSSWSADKDLQNVEPWAQLPCTIRRVARESFYDD